MSHQIIALADVFDVSVADMIGEAVKDARERPASRSENVQLRRRVAQLEGRLARVVSIATLEE